jgi:hypothetical protein
MKRIMQCVLCVRFELRLKKQLSIEHAVPLFSALLIVYNTFLGASLKMAL